MGFQDVVFLPSRVSFFSTFLKNCGRAETLQIATYIKTVVWDKHGNAPCKILLLRHSLILCQLNFMEIIRLSQMR